VKSRNSSQCNETLLVIAVRLRKKFGFQSPAKKHKTNIIYDTCTHLVFD